MTPLEARVHLAASIAAALAKGPAGDLLKPESLCNLVMERVDRLMLEIYRREGQAGECGVANYSRPRSAKQSRPTA